MESEQVTPVDSMKDVDRSSVRVSEFDKHQKKTGGHIDRNVVEITIMMNTIVRKPLMIKSTVEIGQNTEKSPGVLLGLGITQIPMKNHQLTLV